MTWAQFFRTPGAVAALFVAMLLGHYAVGHVVSFGLGPETGTGAIGCAFNGGSNDLNLFFVHACTR